MTTTFKELCDGKVSVALQAMIDGLKEQSKRDDFQIAMYTFGDTEGTDVCFGCAATCAMQQVTGKNFTVDNIKTETSRSQALNVDQCDLESFEMAIDGARRGDLLSLFTYMEDKSYLDEYYDRWGMYTNGWEKELPKVQEFVDMLKMKGS